MLSVPFRVLQRDFSTAPPSLLKVLIVSWIIWVWSLWVIIVAIIAVVLMLAFLSSPVLLSLFFCFAVVVGVRVWCVEVYQSSYIIIIQLKYILTVVDLMVCISERNNNIWKVFCFWWQWFTGCMIRTSRSCGTDEGQRSGLSWKASAVPAARDLLHCSSFCSTTWSVFPRLAVWTSSTKVPTSLYLGGC